MPHRSHIYAKASDMENVTMWTYLQSEHALPQKKCVLRCYADCPCINITYQETTKKMMKQHSQLGFTFTTSLDVVLLMVELHWKTRKSVTCVNKNIHQIDLNIKTVLQFKTRRTSQIQMIYAPVYHPENRISVFMSYLHPLVWLLPLQLKEMSARYPHIDDIHLFIQNIILYWKYITKTITKNILSWCEMKQ